MRIHGFSSGFVAVLCSFLALVTARRGARMGEDSEAMGKRLADLFSSDLGGLVLIAAARMVLHIATNGQHGCHRDGLQTLDDARHLDWGCVVYRPITPRSGP